MTDSTRSAETKCRAYVDGAHYYHYEDHRCACGADKRLAEKDAEIARLTQASESCHRMGERVIANRDQALQQAHAERDALREVNEENVTALYKALGERDIALKAALAADGVIDIYINIVCRDAPDHNAPVLELRKQLRAAVEALTSMERAKQGGAVD